MKNSAVRSRHRALRAIQPGLAERRIRVSLDQKGSDDSDPDHRVASCIAGPRVALGLASLETNERTMKAPRPHAETLVDLLKADPEFAAAYLAAARVAPGP
jgi:hypothetical protein